MLARRALVAGLLAEEKPEVPDPVRLLSDVHTKSVFNFLTLALYILDPERYYPWVRRIHDVVREVFGLRSQEPTPSVDDYLHFCSLLRTVAEELHFSPQALDYLLYDL